MVLKQLGLLCGLRPAKISFHCRDINSQRLQHCPVLFKGVKRGVSVLTEEHGPFKSKVFDDVLHIYWEA